MTTNHPELQAVFDWIDAHRAEAIADLQRFVQQPSVSAQNIGLEECEIPRVLESNPSSFKLKYCMVSYLNSFLV